MKKTEKVVLPYNDDGKDFEGYDNHTWIVGTKGDFDVDFYDSHFKRRPDEEKGIYAIGIVKTPEKNVPVIWNEYGIAVEPFNPEYNLIQYCYITPPNKYENIRINENDNDIDNEFEKKYKFYCSYSNKMNRTEFARYLAFVEDHRNCTSNTGAIGGGIIVSFMGTSLGNIVHVKCECCGEEVDITDSESW